MEYNGIFDSFDLSKIRTYPFEERKNKVTAEDLITPEEAKSLSPYPGRGLDEIASRIVDCRRDGKPVIVFTGAHLIKNGLGLLLADLVDRGLVTLVAGNGATAIHDFELALMGATSENVPAALGQGLFGMAAEFAYINTALSVGNRRKLGYGESLGMMINDSTFRESVLAELAENIKRREFLHPELSLLSQCLKKKIPFTVHVGIGTDVSDQHPSFDGEAKGGCSGRDFQIYCREVSRLTEGGVILNIGSAVTGPEVLLKALSMAANSGSIPDGIITADFDLRAIQPEEAPDDRNASYYFRDQKSVVNRIPAAFGGTGYYIQGNQKTTFPALYQRIINKV